MDRNSSSARTTVRRKPQRASSDRAQLDRILDTAIVGHVGICRPTGPVVLPTAIARDGDRLLIHGSTGGGMFLDANGGADICVEVTHVDGLLFANNPENQSIAYRSAVIFGRAERLPAAEVPAALHVILEHLTPGRAATLRHATPREYAATAVLVLPLDQWSVKVRPYGPSESADDGEDHSVWCGTLPLGITAGEPVASPLTPQGTPVPADVTAAAQRFTTLM